MSKEGNRNKNISAFFVLFATLAFVTVGCASGTIPPEEEWNKTFRGSDSDWRAKSVQQTTDGGHILVGYTGQTGRYNASSKDVLLMKTDSNGNEQWNRTFGGTEDVDKAYSVQQTTDGGYIVAGSTRSYGAGAADVWLVKTDSNGNKEWDKTFGGTGFDWANSVQQTADGGYIIAAFMHSYGDSAFGVIKTDSAGNKQWDKTFGDRGVMAVSAQQTTDGGYIIVGNGGTGILLVKTDSNGNKQWDKVFGGGRAGAGQQTADGGYIIAGSRGGAGLVYAWLIKVKGEPTEPTETPITPEPAKQTSTPVPSPTPTPEEKGVPGFDTAFAIAGLLTVAYLLRRR